MPHSATLPGEVTMRRLLPASSLCVAHTCASLAFGVSAASSVAQPTPRPIQQSTTAIARGQSNGQPSTGGNVRYPTMLDMTFPEFEAAMKRTDIVLLPVGSIEEHSAHLPLGTDAINSTAQLFHVQQYLRNAGVRDDSRSASEHRHHIPRWRRHACRLTRNTREPDRQGVDARRAVSRCAAVAARERITTSVPVARAQRRRAHRGPDTGRRGGQPDDRRHARLRDDR